MSIASRIQEHSALQAADVTWLTQMQDGWTLLADLSFSDLVLWVPDADDNIFWAVAQVRPATGPTCFTDDVVGEQIVYDPDHLVTEAYLSETICETSDNKLQAGIPVDVRAIPILRQGCCIAVVESHTNQMGVRAQGSVEEAYAEAADVMSDMLHHGDFPFARGTLPATPMPRVGDGIIRLDTDRVVRFASPNTLTAFRHLGLAGDLEGESFPAVVGTLMTHDAEPVDEPLLRPTTKSSVVDLDGNRASLRLRILPLRRGGESVGWLALCRDTTELRHRERQLVTKDATIREIHHRVKNNLQTVAALLRMQARRVEAPEAQRALSDAMARVASIALVHEMLSHAYDDAVDFNEVCDRLLAPLSDVAASQGRALARRVGNFGLVRGDVANTLALVVNELAHNAVEHGLRSGAGQVTVRATRGDDDLTVDIEDDGVGLDPARAPGESRGLGLSIVRTLVSDLEGDFSLQPGDERGTVARVVIPARRIRVRA